MCNAVGRLAKRRYSFGDDKKYEHTYNDNSLFHYSGRKIKIEKWFPTKQITPSSEEKREEYWYN